MSSARRFSAFRLVSATVLGALILCCTGDRGVYTAVPGGIDPLEVLNLFVRPNALVVLDSSGSMREMPDADYLTDGSPDTPGGGRGRRATTRPRRWPRPRRPCAPWSKRTRAR